MSDNLVKNPKIQYKSLKVRIYPNKDQETLINKTFGCCRLIYNEHLQERNEFYISNILPIKKTATKTEREWTCKNCGTHHIRDVNAATNLKNYVPWEARESTPVESYYVVNLAKQALHATELDEAGSHSQATGGENVIDF